MIVTCLTEMSRSRRTSILQRASDEKDVRVFYIFLFSFLFFFSSFSLRRTSCRVSFYDVQHAPFLLSTSIALLVVAR